MFSIFFNSHSKIKGHEGKVALGSLVIALIAGIFAYHCFGGPGHILPITPSAGCILSGISLLFIIDSIRYAFLYYRKIARSKKLVSIVSSPPIAASSTPTSPATSTMCTASPLFGAINHQLFHMPDLVRIIDIYGGALEKEFSELEEGYNRIIWTLSGRDFAQNDIDQAYDKLVKFTEQYPKFSSHLPEKFIVPPTFISGRFS